MNNTNHPETTNQSQQENLPAINYPKVYAYGGLLINLFYCAKNGKKSNERFRSFCDIQQQNNESSGGTGDTSSKILTYLYNWLLGTNVENDEYQRFYNKLFGILVDCDRNNYKDKILDFLSDEIKERSNTGNSTNDATSKLKKRIEEIKSAVEKFNNNNNNNNLSERFKDAAPGLEKGLMILFYMKDFTDYLDDSDNNVIETLGEITKEQELVLYYALLGVRNKFIKTPSFLRKYQGVQEFVSAKMAEYAHKIRKTNVQFTPPEAPKTVYEIIEKPQKQAIKHLPIKECIETIMSGCFRRGKKNNMYIYPGYQEPKYKIIHEKLFKEMREKHIDDDLYNKLVKTK